MIENYKSYYSDDSTSYMKKLTQGEIYSFSSMNIIIDTAPYNTFILMGMMQLIGSVILACIRISSTSYKIIDLINLTEFNNEHWITSIENNQIKFSPIKSANDSKGIIIKSIF